MVRPQRSSIRRGLVAALAALALLGVAACADPNAIGVQDYGTIYGAVINSKNNQPISGALVSAAGYQARTDPSGGFTLRVPIGQQTVSVNAAGFAPATQDVNVLKNQSAPIGTNAYIFLTPSV